MVKQRKGMLRLTSYSLEDASNDLSSIDKRVIPNLPLPKGVTPPKNSMVGLYGFTFARAHMKPIAREALSNNQSILYLHYELDVGNLGILQQEPENLGDTGLLNLIKCKTTLFTEINREWMKTHKSLLFNFSDPLPAWSDRLDYVEEIFDWDMFKHIKAIVLNVPDPSMPSKALPVSLVRARNVIDKTFADGYPDIEVSLPKRIINYEIG